MADKKPTRPVVSQAATIKKEKTIDKFFRSLLVTDSVNLKDYILYDVAIPLIKRGISSTINMLLYGNANAPTNGTGYYYTNNVKPTAYNGFYTMRPNTPQPVQPSIFRSVNTTGFQNLAFSSHADADAVLQGLRESIAQFGIVSAGEMYDMAKVPTDNYTLNQIGWTNLDGVGIIRDGGGYVINLPKPTPIK